MRQQIKSSKEFQQTSNEFQAAFSELLDYFQVNAMPYLSLRYQAHMLWDNTLPAIAEYYAGMLHNSNIVSFQASTSTTPIEMLVGWDLCELVGFTFESSIEPWRHLNCGRYDYKSAMPLGYSRALVFTLCSKRYSSK